jgi:hypothetical protein
MYMYKCTSALAIISILIQALFVHTEYPCVLPNMENAGPMSFYGTVMDEHRNMRSQAATDQ